MTNVVKVELNDVGEHLYRRLLKCIETCSFKRDDCRGHERLRPVTMLLSIGEDGSNMFDTTPIETFAIAFEKILNESNSISMCVGAIDVEGPFQIKDPKSILPNSTSNTHAAWKVTYQIVK
jgi:hypothetical protein